jgi:hypothetical protein
MKNDATRFTTTRARKPISPARTILVNLGVTRMRPLRYRNSMPSATPAVPTTACRTMAELRPVNSSLMPPRKTPSMAA